VKRRSRHKAKALAPPAARTGARLLAGLLLAIGTALLVLRGADRPGEPRVAGPAAQPAPAGAATSPGAAGTDGPGASERAVDADVARLVGQWLRTDYEYMIDIRAASPDGTLEARYLNPRPIHVSRAAWSRADGRLQVRVQMQDRGYPGNFYTLSYDPAGDGLHGTYHHLGLNQSFEVSFDRFAAGEERPREEEP
jgi:hypothetical protein